MMQPSNQQWSERWDDFIRMHHPDTGFMQYSWWVELVTDSPEWNYLDAFNLDNDGAITGGAKVLCHEFKPGKAFLYIPDGPLLADDEPRAADQFNALMGYLEDWRGAQQGLQITHLRIEPEWCSSPVSLAGFESFTGWIEPRATRYVDLTKSIPGLMAGMTTKGRSRIKKAVASGVTFVEDFSPTAVNDFLAIYRETMDRQGVDPMDERYHRQLLDTLRRRQTGSLCFAEHEGERLATAMVIYHGNRVTYFFAGSRSGRRELMAPYLLNFMIMMSAKYKGFKTYDLYGIAPTSDKSHPWAGFSEFKKNFGGEAVFYTPAMDKIWDPDGYAEYLKVLRDE